MDWEETNTREEENAVGESEETLEGAEDQQEPESAAQREAREKREEDVRKRLPPIK